MDPTPTPIRFQVNGQPYGQVVPPGITLLSLLRELGWVGVRRRRGVFRLPRDP